MDVDLPDAWMEDPGLFLRKSYEEKLAMIGALRTPITPQMVIEEINRYADSEMRYAGTEDETAVAAMVRDLRHQEEARKRFLGGRAS